MTRRTCEDLTGQVFGPLTVTGPARRDRNGQRRWHYRCACGHNGTTNKHKLNQAMAINRPCACHRANRNSVRLPDPTVGERFGPVVVTGPRAAWSGRITGWPVRCDCGKEGMKNVRLLYTLRLSDRLCACRREVRVRHNGRSLTLAEWSRELGLPYDTFATRYRAGKRGEELVSPERLSTPSKFLPDGATDTLVGLSAKHGVALRTLQWRLKKGWSLEQALGIAPRKRPAPPHPPRQRSELLPAEETRSFSQVARDAGISRIALRHRLAAGVPYHAALTMTPAQWNASQGLPAPKRGRPRKPSTEKKPDGSPLPPEG